jgi:hypothetical protein
MKCSCSTTRCSFLQGFEFSRICMGGFELAARSKRLASGPVSSATCLRESVLPIRLRPDFSVVFGGYAGGAKHWHRCRKARKWSPLVDILRTC